MTPNDASNFHRRGFPKFAAKFYEVAARENIHLYQSKKNNILQEMILFISIVLFLLEKQSDMTI